MQTYALLKSCLIAGLLLALLQGAHASPSASSPLEAFDAVWKTAKANIYPGALERQFTRERYHALRSAAERAQTLDEVAAILNPFLDSLHVSHTQLYTTTDLEYYVLASLFTTRRVDAPVVSHIGAQYARVGDHHVIRAVLEGYPAAKAGLRRGDVMLEANGAPFHPVRSFEGTSPVGLSARRGRQTLSLRIVPVLESFHLSLLRATERSVRILRPEGAKGPTIGYVHLWSGTDKKFLEALARAVNGPLAKADALILDLRDGFGGAWQDYLDPFFPDRKQYFVATRLLRDGRRETLAPEPGTAHKWYKGRMVVLINEGVRSGKECLAFQFKKTRRAVLVGETTAGAFVGGRGFFSEAPRGYILYLSVFGMLLDGVQLEGKGVAPDVRVPWPWTAPGKGDPQMTEALKHIR